MIYTESNTKGQNEVPCHPSTPCPPNNPTPTTFQVDNQMTSIFQSTKKLAVTEMVISCLVLLCGIATTVLSASVLAYPGTYICTFGTAIWAPVLCIIAAGLGLGALRHEIDKRKCLLVSHFVMCIISALACGVLIVFTGLCLSGASDLLSFYNYNRYHDDDFGLSPYYSSWYFPRGSPETMIALEAFILAGALTLLITNIVSSAYICRYWCGNSHGTGASTILYVPTQTTGGNGLAQVITVPPGAQVIFLQSNHLNGQIPPPVAVPIAP